MKRLLLASLLLLGSGLRASPIIVYGKGDFAELSAGTPLPPPSDPTKANLLASFRTDLARPQTFLPPIKLTDFPQWGRTVPGAQGQLQFHASSPHGFIVMVRLEGLLAEHRYILTLNGNPTRAGNDRLVDPVPGNEQEKYYDFLTITTDAAGRYEATCAVALPTGPYDVRFYVKDTVDFKIVLYHDFFQFAVE